MRDGSAEGHISVLLVHVDGISACQVTENDAVVPNAAGLLLKNLRGRDDLTLDLADLVLSLHVVPELGSGEHGITRENTHAVKFGIRIILAGESSSDDEELSHLNQNDKGPSPAALDKNE